MSVDTQQGQEQGERLGTGLDLGFVFIGVKWGGPTVSWAHSLLVNLKYNSQGREKQVTQMVSYQNQYLQHKEASVGRVGLTV